MDNFYYIYERFTGLWRLPISPKNSQKYNSDGIDLRENCVNLKSHSGSHNNYCKTIRTGHSVLVLNSESKAIEVIQLTKQGKITNKSIKIDINQILETTSKGSDQQKIQIVDHVIYGDKKSKIVVLTKQLNLILLEFDIYLEHFRVLDDIQVHYCYKLGGDTGATLAVCPSSRFLAVHTRHKGNKAGKVVIYDLRNGVFEYKNSVSFARNNVNYFKCMEFSGYFGNHLFLLCLSSAAEKTMFFNLDYNTESEVFCEIQKLRTSKKMSQIYRMQMVAGLLRFSDSSGRICQAIYHD